MDGNKVHTSIVIELANPEEAEYQKAYQIDFGELDIQRDYVIDQIFCGENVTVYAVFEISDEPRKPEKLLEEPKFDVHGDYRIYSEKSAGKLIDGEKYCKYLTKVRSEDITKFPSTESCGVLSRIPKEEENHRKEEKGLNSKALYVPEKISLGTNTSMAKFTPLFYDKKAMQDATELKSANIKVEDETPGKSEGQKSQPKEKSKSTILKEIKKLQKKINSLIRTIESSDFDLDAEDLEISGADSAIYEEAPKNLEVDVLELEPLGKKKKKYDEIPIFSPLTYPTVPRRAPSKPKKTSKETEKREIPVALTRSVSLLSVGSSTTQIINNSEKSETTLRKVSSECSINWHDLENWRGAGHSKSEVINNLLLLDPKYTVMKGVKKSLSLEVRDEKVEVICLKKIKNLPFKLEQSLKSKGNMRILPKREPSLRDSLPLLNCEMGDEVNKKTKASKVDLLGIVQVCDKQNAISFEKINLTPNKNLNEEEGDAKLVYQKPNLASPRFSRNNAELEVHFCSATNNAASDGLLKIEKNVQTNKVKVKAVDNSTDPGPKVCSDSEKPTTPNRTSRKTNTSIPEGKKETKPIKKSNKKKPKEKFEKIEGKDVSPPESVRPKSAAVCRKHSAKGSPEPKTHADRPIKQDIINNHKPSQPVKYSSDEKPVTKVDRLPRPVSQKKETPEPPGDCIESKEKECKTSKKSSLVVNLSQKKSSTGLTTEKLETTSPGENEPEKSSDAKNGQTSEQQPPSVVVELFTEKPQPERTILNEVHKKRSISKENPEAEDEPAIGDVSKIQGMNSEDSDEFKKPVVKSLWALTKLILFEDGTQKLEILEASLNPPEWV